MLMNDQNKLILILQSTENMKEQIDSIKLIDPDFLSSGLFRDFLSSRKIVSNYLESRRELIRTLINIGLIHFAKNKFTQVIDFFSNILTFYSSHLSYKNVTNILDKLSLSYEYTNESKKSEPFLQRAIELSRSSNNAEDLSYFTSCLGNIYFKVHNYKKSLEFHKIACRTSIKLQNERSTAVSYNNIGNVYMRLNNYEKALENYLKSLDLKQKQPNKKDVAFTINNIGNLYYRINKYAQALKFYKQALQLNEEMNNEKGKSISLNNIGITYDDLKDYDKAMESHSESLKIKQKLNDQSGISASLNNIGNVLRYQKKYEEALDYYTKSLQIKNEIQDQLGIALTSNNIGHIYMKLKQFDVAFSYLDQSMQMADKIGAKELQKINLGTLSEYYDKVHDYKNALIYYKKYSKLNEKINDEKTGKRILQMQQNFEIEQEVRENKTLHLQDIVDKYSLISKELERRIDKTFIGESKAIKSILKQTMQVAQYQDTNVLIIGESGTGKEIIADIIHHSGSRKEHNFCPINCSAIPETLLETEFFGHKKGTFSGADSDKKGLFELADKGTIFLDEIADMTLPLQAKLLRAIEEKKIKKLGQQEEIPVDVRIIAATNQDIEEQVRNKEFRLDLFHRLNTIIIHIPPLRERPDDIEPLVRHFVQAFTQNMNKSFPEIDNNVFDVLKEYSFPGNVRELKNLVERAMIFCENNILDAQCFPLSKPIVTSFEEENHNIKETERKLIISALNKTRFNQSKAAILLGISRQTLIRRLVEHNIIFQKK